MRESVRLASLLLDLLDPPDCLLRIESVVQWSQHQAEFLQSTPLDVQTISARFGSGMSSIFCSPALFPLVNLGFFPAAGLSLSN
jgi:hypothetical protein